MSEVRLNVYDLSMGMAAGMSQQFLGVRIELIPHTGVVVFGKEFFFSGGIQALPPHQVVETFGMAPVRVHTCGVTHVTEAEFRAFLRSIAHKYTMATYDLFDNNCNHFSAAALSFLLPGGSGVPEYISSVPTIVRSSPMGAMIASMMAQAQTGMAGRAATLGAAADPFAAMARAPMPASAAVDAPAAAPPAAAAAAAAVCVSAELSKPAKPLTSAELGNVSGVVAKLTTNAASCDGMTEARLAALRVLPSLVSVGIDGLAAHPAECAAVCDVLGHLAVRVVDATPSLAFHTLCLLRVCALSPAAVVHLTTPVAADALSALDAVLTRCRAATMYDARPANLMALSTLANVFATAAGAAWAVGEETRRAALVDVALRELRSGAEKERRLLASALAYNICTALPLGSDSNGCEPGSLGNSTKPGDATVVITDTSVQLLCGLIEDVTTEAEPEIARRRLLAAGRLLQREGAEAGALLSTLGMDAAVQSVVADAARSADLRGIAREVLALIQPVPGV